MKPVADKCQSCVNGLVYRDLHTNQVVCCKLLGGQMNGVAECNNFKSRSLPVSEVRRAAMDVTVAESLDLPEDRAQAVEEGMQERLDPYKRSALVASHAALQEFLIKTFPNVVKDVEKGRPFGCISDVALVVAKSHEDLAMRHKALNDRFEILEASHDHFVARTAALLRFMEDRGTSPPKRQGENVLDWIVRGFAVGDQMNQSEHQGQNLKLLVEKTEVEFVEGEGYLIGPAPTIPVITSWGGDPLPKTQEISDETIKAKALSFLENEEHPDPEAPEVSAGLTAAEWDAKYGSIPVRPSEGKSCVTPLAEDGSHG